MFFGRVSYVLKSILTWNAQEWSMHTAALWLGQSGAAKLATKNAIARDTISKPSNLWSRLIGFDCGHFSECGGIEFTAIRSLYAVDVVPFV